MSRPRISRRDLPPRMYYKHGAYYHVVGNQWYRLGPGLVDALKGYYERELNALPDGDKLTFDVLRNEYLAKGMVDLEPRTRRDYQKQLQRLAAFFSGMALEAIKPHHVVRYHTLRSQTAKVQANREKAVLSLVWNWGRRMGYTKLPNPCQGVRRNREQPPRSARLGFDLPPCVAKGRLAHTRRARHRSLHGAATRRRTQDEAYRHSRR